MKKLFSLLIVVCLLRVYSKTIEPLKTLDFIAVL